MTPADPVPTDTRPATIARDLAHLTDQLAARDSLAPGPEVDRLFSATVHLVTATPPHEARHVLDDPHLAARVARLRTLSAHGESALESHWSARVAAASDPDAELARFPYRGNYHALVDLELALLGRHLNGRRPCSVVVLGCGPLPLTATGYAAGLGAPTLAVDRDAAAVTAARAFLAATGGRMIDVVHDDAARIPLRPHDVVVLAALVGTTTADKTALLRSISDRMRPGTLLLARSAHGLRTLLYPEVDVDAMPGFEVLDVKHPAGDVINSMIVARRV